MSLMNIINHSASSQSRNRSQTLEKLWQDYEKKQLRNKRYRTKLEDFYHEFTSQLLEKEQAVCDASAQWVRHLLTFVPRKSIKGRQREALLEWVEEEISIIESNPFNPINTNEIRDSFTSQLMAYQATLPKQDIGQHELDAFREELESMFGFELDIDDAALFELIDDAAKFQAFFEQKLAEQHNQAFDNDDTDNAFEQDETEYDAEEDDFFFQSTQPEQALSIELFSDKTMTKLYRQLANQFHPDKEPELAKKALKKELMQQLSQVKKGKDAVALLMLALEYLPEYKLEADADMIKRIEAALRVKIGLLNRDYQSMQNGNDIKTMIWERFGSGSKASRAKELAQYGDVLTIETEELLAKVTKIKTVQAIQKELNQRSQRGSFKDIFDLAMFNDETLDEFWQYK
ncbi:J domain-containing protein [Shewanella glacialipiscicola]|uniref:J domain-containing protein n=1 Tax=Shewanella glacialipiscicola TaxID=614069 RepID=UPI0021D9C384|nr:J domain-containing protein [Shewanella glacialipiscicola]MCU7994715.1 J domain-containing protein [Shewanella glacialipiscicola]MCU8026186.1 J domain-containing protein [Shewanella glacialipiscicola]